MKKFALLLTLLVLTAGTFAQQTKTKEKTTNPTSKSKSKMQDCVMMEDGKMMVMKKGKMHELSTDTTLSNGTMVMMDGTVKMKNGKSVMLKDGNCIYMNGKVDTTMKHKMKGMK